MFGIGTTEVLIILAVALLVIGPSKLPEVAKALGKGMAEFKKMSSDVKRTIDMETHMAEMEEEEEKKRDRSATEGPADDPAAEFTTEPPPAEPEMAESQGLENEFSTSSPAEAGASAQNPENHIQDFGTDEEPDATLQSAQTQPSSQDSQSAETQDIERGKRDA